MSTVAVSTDRGTTWSEVRPFRDGLDLTDLAKGHRQYLLRFDAGDIGPDYQHGHAHADLPLAATS